MTIKEFTKLEGLDHIREMRRIADNHQCQCGFIGKPACQYHDPIQPCLRRWEDGKRRFDIHHLDEEFEGKKGSYKYDRENFERLVTMCHKCHLNLPHIVKKQMASALRQSYSQDEL